MAIYDLRFLIYDFSAFRLSQSSIINHQS